MELKIGRPSKSLNKGSDKLDEEIRKWYYLGKLDKEIAQLMGVSETLVQSRRYRAGLIKTKRGRPRPLTFIDKSTILDKGENMNIVDGELKVKADKKLERAVASELEKEDPRDFDKKAFAEMVEDNGVLAIPPKNKEKYRRM